MNEAERQVQNLLDSATEPLMPEDPLGMIPHGKTRLAMQMWVWQQKQKLAQGKQLDYGERTVENGNNPGS